VLQLVEVVLQDVDQVGGVANEPEVRASEQSGRVKADLGLIGRDLPGPERVVADERLRERPC
jgi:hypothetical protein